MDGHGEDSEEFAYFLPRGIEDDADDFGGYNLDLDNHMDASAAGGAPDTELRTLATHDDVGSAYSSAAFGLSSTSWQSQQSTQATAQSSQAQQAALLSVLQQRQNARQLQSQQQSQLQYGGSNSSADALLAAFYGQQQQQSAPSYYNPSPPPAHSPANGFTANNSSSDATSQAQHQLQFYQQLQLYQQQLQMQQQQQMSLGGGGSHYTKAPPGLSYDDPQSSRLDEKPLSDLGAPDRLRRRPLPHHSHANVTIMNRPPSDDRESASQMHQPKTTVVTATATSTAATSASAVLSSSSWGAGHSSTLHGSSAAHEKSSYVKHIPQSVVASTQVQVWPKVAAVAKNAAATAPAATTDKKAAASSTAKSNQKGNAATAATIAAPKRAGPPVATIRHIESEEPVPLTATEMAGLNAHHRKAATLAAPVVEKADSIPSPAAAVVKRVREHRHEHTKYSPNPPALPNDNVFDFLFDIDSDDLPPPTEERSKRKGKKHGEKAPVVAIVSESEEEEDEAPEEEESEEEEEEAEDQEDSSDAEVDAEATDEEGSEADEEAVVESEEESEEEVSSPSAPSSPSSGRVSSPPISPTTGLPVQPILKQPVTSPTASHTRRVSFQQPPTKKQLAAARDREQPVVKSTAWKDGGGPAANAAAQAEAEESAPTTSAVSYPVESVSGLKKKKKQAAKAMAAAAAAAPAPLASKPVATEPVEASSVSSEAATAVDLGGFLSVLMALVSTFVTSRSRSVSSRAFSLVSYLLGVVAGLAWTVVCVVARVHRHAATVLTSDHQMAFCFAFLYLFPYAVHHMVYWAPPWAAPCVWYAFLMQVFCTTGAPWLVALFRVLLPLLFLTEGVSHHTFLLELNGAERLVCAFVLASFKTQEYRRPMFLSALALQIVTSLFYGNHVLAQWSLLICSLMVIHERNPALAPLVTTPIAKSKIVAPLAPIASEATAADVPGSVPPAVHATPTAPAASWFGSVFGSGGMASAFNRRARAKAGPPGPLKARRIGRF